MTICLIILSILVALGFIAIVLVCLLSMFNGGVEASKIIEDFINNIKGVFGSTVEPKYAIALYVLGCLAAAALIYYVVVVIVKKKPLHLLFGLLVIVGMASSLFGLYFGFDYPTVNIAKGVEYIFVPVCLGILILCFIFEQLLLYKKVEVAEEKPVELETVPYVKEEEPKEEVEEEKPEEIVAPVLIEEEEEKPVPDKKPVVKKTTKEPAAVAKTRAKPTQKVEKPVAKPTPKPKEVKTVGAAKDRATGKGLRVYHVSRTADKTRWQVKLSDSNKIIKTFDTQKEAIDYAKRVAKLYGCSYQVHSKEGKLRKA